MVSKSKRRSKRRSTVNPLDDVQRNLQRGNFKQALKAARVCHRQNPTQEHRAVLEHAYIGRAQQLVQQGQREDSRRITQDLLDLGVTEPSVEAALPQLLVSLGMLDRLPEGHDALSGEEGDRLRLKAADQAVLRPKDVPETMPEIRDGALKARAALEAVQQGDESAAPEHLKDISRYSPFADWKYFVRGLAAYYRHDKSDMLANWDRLDADRAAVRIAAPLRVMAGVVPPQQGSRLRTKVSRLEKQATNQNVLGQLTSLRQSVTDHDWPQVFKTLRTVRGELRKLDAGVYRRLVSCLCGIFVHDGLVDELERLSRIADPLPIDPYWNRARALVREQSEDYDESDTEGYWRKYLRDLENASSLTPSERKLARALVWLKLADSCLNEARFWQGCRCGRDHTLDIEEAEERALDAFEQCLTLAPDYAPAYQAMAGFHMAAHRPDAAAQVLRRLLQHVPDDVNALLFLGNHYIAHDEPLKAREFAERARQHKPLDKNVADLLWTTHVGAARHFTREGQCDKARDELAAADRLRPARGGDYDVLARKAVLEIKAGDAAAARRHVEQAQEKLVEPTALWLVMTIEAIRYDLPKEETWLYEKRWKDALKRRCRSETAGLMCKMLNAHLKTQQPYLHRREHVEHLLKYIRRCSRVKWQAEDLRDVCDFLEEMDDTKLLEKYAKQGIRKCPEVAYFHLMAGTAEVEKGPVRCNRQLALEHLEKAVELGSASNDPRDKDVVKTAKRGATLLEHISSHYIGDYDDDDEYDDEYDDDEYESYGGEPVGMSPNELVGVIQDICDRLGLEPHEVLNELAGGQSAEPRRTRKKKKR